MSNYHTYKLKDHQLEQTLYFSCKISNRNNHTSSGVSLPVVINEETLDVLFIAFDAFTIKSNNFSFTLRLDKSGLDIV